MLGAVVMLGAVLGIGIGLGAGSAWAQAAPPPTPVTVVTLEAQDLTLTSTLPGRVVASGVAEVRPQVDGIIVERLYEEGAHVAVGDLLYRIDSATYEAQVAAAEAQVAQAQARLTSAEKDAERVHALVERRATSQQALDDAVAERDAAEAGLKVAEAEHLAAQIDLDRTTIRAPLSGIIGRSLTTQGSLVTAGQVAPLAVIRTIDPVKVDVTQSAAEIIAWRRGTTAQRLAGAQQTVKLTLADGKPYEHTGLLTAAEPYVHEQTGVVTLRLEFPNPDELLLPGMYVQVEMPQAVAENVILAPQEGVMRDRRGRPIAYVVNDQNVVEERVLTVLQAHGAFWVTSEGLADGDRIVVAGLQKIRPGATVAPAERETAPDGSGKGANLAARDG
ncbi:MAG: efflux RND transporter periplasmic adaptor subunit [Geminicoccaceae bacterium]